MEVTETKPETITFKLDSIAFHTQFSRALVCTDKGRSRGEWKRMINVEVDSVASLWVIATDGKTLYKGRLQSFERSDVLSKFILDREDVATMLKTFPKTEGYSINVEITGRDIKFSFFGQSLAFRTVIGDFPNYTSIFNERESYQPANGLFFFSPILTTILKTCGKEDVKIYLFSPLEGQTSAPSFLDLKDGTFIIMPLEGV